MNLEIALHLVREIVDLVENLGLGGACLNREVMTVLEDGPVMAFVRMDDASRRDPSPVVGLGILRRHRASSSDEGEAALVGIDSAADLKEILVESALPFSPLMTVDHVLGIDTKIGLVNPDFARKYREFLMFQHSQDFISPKQSGRQGDPACMGRLSQRQSVYQKGKELVDLPGHQLRLVEYGRRPSRERLSAGGAAETLISGTVVSASSYNTFLPAIRALPETNNSHPQKIGFVIRHRRYPFRLVQSAPCGKLLH